MDREAANENHDSAEGGETSMTPTEARALIAGLTYCEKLQLLALLKEIKSERSIPA